MRNFLLHFKSKRKGQSFVELAIFAMVLVGMFAGMVEAGNLLNQYINIVDGAREGARGVSNTSPFLNSAAGDFSAQPTFYNGVDKIIEGVLGLDGKFHDAAIAPLTLDPSAGDDIVITVFAVSSRTVRQTFPSHLDPAMVGHSVNLCDCWSVYNKQESRIKAAQIAPQLLSLSSTTPDSGLVVVEIFYSYPTILKFGVNRIPVYAYVIMPLSAAEPTKIPPSPTP